MIFCLFWKEIWSKLTILDEQEEDYPVKGDHCFDNGFGWQKQYADANILIEKKLQP